ncbi:MAG: egtD [Candidatus Midichloriaceae bacterium]|jgi:L-histidine N-alpha-methyltransferase|nr:egtD [Candidatus Midichloriaceae bacterium]
MNPQVKELLQQGSLEDYLDFLYQIRKFHMTKYLYNSLDGVDHYSEVVKFKDYYLKQHDIDLLGSLTKNSALGKYHNCIIFEIGPGCPETLKTKTIPLVDAFKPKQYVAVDFTASYAEQASDTMSKERSSIYTWYTVCDAFKALPILQSKTPSIIAVLGSTLGNLSDAELRAFFRYLGNNLRKGDGLLFTADSCLDEEMLLRAYNNPHMEGLVKNIMRNLKHEFNISSLNPELFTLQVNWNRGEKSVELNLIATHKQSFMLDGYEINIEEGAQYGVSKSHKFQAHEINNLAMRYGFRVELIHTLPGNNMKFVLIEKA